MVTEMSGISIPNEAEIQHYQQQINSVTAPQIEKKDSHEGILLNVDSTLLRLDDSGLDDTESGQEGAPRAMQIHRMNDTDMATAAF